MQTLNQPIQNAAGLHWPAFFFTGPWENGVGAALASIASRKAADSYASWTLAWARKPVIAKALAASPVKLRASVRKINDKCTDALEDAAILPDVHRDLVRDAKLIGRRQLTRDLATHQGWTSTGQSNRLTSEIENA
jgi:hypothetical protein